MLHGDSRAFGRSISDFYSKKAKKLFGLQQIYKKFHYGIMASEKIPDRVKTVFEKFNYKVNRFKSGLIWKMNIQKANRKYSFPSISKGTEEEKAFKLSAYAAQNFGYANRASMIAVIRDAMKKAFNGDNSDLRILYDGNHDCLQEERVDGVTYLAHRNGASRAGSSREYREHPVFSRTGQPVLLPSSMGNPSFLMAAYDGSKGSFYSAPHGAGRIIDRGEAREKFGKNDVIALVESRGVRVYDYGKGNVSEESPDAVSPVICSPACCCQTDKSIYSGISILFRADCVGSSNCHKIWFTVSIERFSE
jgi:RNA-splicing ligase RtcB